ncbi:hypothetical protein AAZX31_12G020200 [Glycine max]
MRILLRRKLEEQNELQQVIQLQERRLMNLHLLGLSIITFAITNVVSPIELLCPHHKFIVILTTALKEINITVTTLIQLACMILAVGIRRVQRQK